MRKAVFASSNAVYGYGPGVKGDLVESTPFHSVGAPPAAIIYGATKIIGEALCRDYHRKHGLDYVVLRYSTVYGERQHYRAANALYIIETLDKVRKGERPQVLRRRRETKHFVYVGDLARANRMAFEADGDRCRGEHLRPEAGHHAGAGAAGDEAGRRPGRRAGARIHRRGQRARCG